MDRNPPSWWDWAYLLLARGRRLVRIVRRDSGSVMTWRRAQMVLLSAQGLDVAGIAYTPTNSSWLNRIEAQFTALRYFALEGTGHATHQEQASTIRRYIHLAQQPRLRPTTLPGQRYRSSVWGHAVLAVDHRRE